MSLVRNFLAFWYDFIVGDDWTVAVGIVGLLIVCGVLAHAQPGMATWIVMPIGVVAVLALSIRNAIRT